MILHKEKLIFVHIPKNAGTSVEECFQHRFSPSGIDDPFNVDRVYDETEAHLPARLIKRSFPDIFESYLKFCVVRNTYARVVSSYLWLKRSYGVPCSFRRWVKQGFPGTPTRELNIFMKPAQLEWITDNNGNLLVDFVCDFETLQPHFDQVCERAGIAARRLPHANSSKPRFNRYSKYYDRESTEIISTMYKSDIEYFGFRSHHKIPVFRPAPDGIEPWLNLSNAAPLPRRCAKDAQARR